jgi:hypothetical protein
LLWDPRKGRNEAAPSAGLHAQQQRGGTGGAALADEGQVYPTKALRKFLASLTSREAPVLLDLGPVVGSNVTFFGERLGCKILIEDLFSDLDRHSRNGATPFADYLKGRLKHQPGSVDGILCWNFFDFLEPAAAQVLSRALTQLVRPDGAVLGFFSTIAAADTQFTRYVIVDEDSLKQKPYAERGKKQAALQNRDIIRLFDGLKVSESFLLKTNVREFLFRKPAAPVTTQ